MRFGAMNFPVRPVMDEIAAVAGLGMDYLELAMDPPEAHYRTLGAGRRAIRGALAERGLGLVCHLPTFVHTADLADAIREASLGEVIGSLEVAADLGAEMAVLHPGYIRGLAIHVPETALALAMESIGRVADRADRLGVPLGLENLFSGLGPYGSPAEMEGLLEAFPQCSLVLDVGHANIEDSTGRRSVDFIERFGARLGHLHLSDNRGRCDEHLPLGAGRVDFASVAGALAAAGYDGTATLEIFCDDRRQLARSRERMDALLLQARARRAGRPGFRR